MTADPPRAGALHGNGGLRPNRQGAHLCDVGLGRPLAAHVYEALEKKGDAASLLPH